MWPQSNDNWLYRFLETQIYTERISLHKQVKSHDKMPVSPGSIGHFCSNGNITESPYLLPSSSEKPWAFPLETVLRTKDLCQSMLSR